jgi:predicted PurR-regulated permease PerM
MERSDRWLPLAVRGVLLLAFFWVVRAELVPLALAGLFALLLDPLRRRLVRRRGFLGRHAALVLTALAVVCVVIPFVVVAARVVVSVNDFLAHGLPDVLAKLQSFWSGYLQGIAGSLAIPIEKLSGAAGALAQKAGTVIAATAGGFASALPGQIVDLFLFVLGLYYFLRDGAALMRWLMRLSPFAASETDKLFASIRETVHGSIFGQLATSAVQGGLTMIALYVLGVPGALLFGILAMLLSVLPMVGTIPVTVGATIYLFAADKPIRAIIMAVAALVIGLSDNVVRPWVQSSQTRMHPLVVLIAIFGGIDAFGASGVFLGPVLAAIAIWTLDYYAKRSRERKAAEDPTDGAPEDDAPEGRP